MSVIPVDRVINTVLSWFQLETPTFNTIIDQYYQGKQINFFKYLRKVIPESSYPSIEVGPTGDNLKWGFVRVQQDEINLEIHLTLSNKIPQYAGDLESRLISLIIRILSDPQNLRSRIEGTNIWFQDSFPKGVTYGAAGYSYNIRVGKIEWGCSGLVYLRDDQFPVSLQEGGDHFPV